MGCWKWFNSILKEAEVQVTDQNKSKIDDVIHKYIGKQASYGRCSANWKKARKELEPIPELKRNLKAREKSPQRNQRKSRNETRTHPTTQNESLANIGPSKLKRLGLSKQRDYRNFFENGVNKTKRLSFSNRHNKKKIVNRFIAL